MAYTVWSVVYGEQPTAAKWNQLGANDASFNDGTGIADDKIIARHIDWATTGANGGIWWEELGRTTLSSPGTVITINSFASRKYLKIFSSLLPSGGTINSALRFNNDSANNYNFRYADNGAADLTTGATGSNFLDAGAGNFPFYAYADILNHTSFEKICAYHANNSGTAGAANAPNRREATGKWVNTSSQITRIDVTTSTNNYASGSEVIVLGHD